MAWISLALLLLAVASIPYELTRERQRLLGPGEPQPRQVDEAARRAAVMAAREKSVADVRRVQEWIGASAKTEPLIKRFVVDDATLTVFVMDPWHQQAQELRLQLAREIWQAWADIHSPDHPDASFLHLKDREGNTVGGSGVDGSAITVENERPR